MAKKKKKKKKAKKKKRACTMLCRIGIPSTTLLYPQNIALSTTVLVESEC